MGNVSIMSGPEFAAAAMSQHDLTIDLMRPFALNFQEQIGFVLNVYAGLIYALLYIWVKPFPFIFLSIYHWCEQPISLLFLGLCIGTFIIMPPFFAYLYYIWDPKYDNKGELKSEEHCPSPSSAICLSPCFFWFWMDIVQECALDCANHRVKPLQHRCAPPLCASPFPSYSLQTHRD